MKIALISDIQGNGVALEAVLRQLETDQPDVMVCLGDVASGYEPVTVLNMLGAVGCHVVKGNMDDVILHPHPYAGDDPDEQKFSEMDAWCSAQLSPTHRAYMESFVPTLSLEVGEGKRLLCVHGSARSYDDVVDHTTPDEELKRLFAGYTENIIATGHMHNPLLRRVGERVMINPGSVGLPGGGRKLMPLVAEYAVMTPDRIQFCTVRYDAATFRRRVLGSGMPHAAWYLSKWD